VAPSRGSRKAVRHHSQPQAGERAQIIHVVRDVGPFVAWRDDHHVAGVGHPFHHVHRWQSILTGLPSCPPARRGTVPRLLILKQSVAKIALVTTGAVTTGFHRSPSSPAISVIDSSETWAAPVFRRTEASFVLRYSVISPAALHGHHVQTEDHMASFIGRRRFLATLGGSAVVWPLRRA
jgi:hypothetical protein